MSLTIEAAKGTMLKHGLRREQANSFLMYIQSRIQNEFWNVPNNDKEVWWNICNARCEIVVQAIKELIEENKI